MRRTIYTTLLLFFALSVSAGQRTKEQAQAIAQKLAERIGTVVESDVASSAKAKHKAASTVVETNAYYVFNNGTDNGYIIVSGEDKLPAIVGYTDKGSFDADDMPIQLKEFLESYTELVGSVEDGTVSLVSDISDDNVNSGSTTPVNALLGKTMWDQSSPYNLQCPEIEGAHCVTGCLATALAQIMYYYKYPSALPARIPSYTRGTTTYDAIELSTETSENAYDWDNMLPQYTSSATQNQMDAVAKLMNHIGHVAHSAYGLNGTSADEGLYDDVFTFFKYDTSLLQYIKKEDYTYSEWKTMITNEIEHSRPVAYAGQAGSSGHAFVLDGVDANGLYHVNWGWSGSDNGYFDVTILNPNDNSGIGASSSTDGYNGNASMLVGITPKNTNNEQKYSESTSAPSTTTENLTFTLTDKNGGTTLYRNPKVNIINRVKLTVINNGSQEYYGSTKVIKDSLSTTTSSVPLYICVPANSTAIYDITCTIPTGYTNKKYYVTAFDTQQEFAIVDVDTAKLTVTSITSNASTTNFTPKDIVISNTNTTFLFPTLKSNSISYTVTIRNDGGYYYGSDLAVGFYTSSDTKFHGYYKKLELPAGEESTFTFTDNNLTIGDLTGIAVWTNKKITLEKSSTQTLLEPNSMSSYSFNNRHFVYVAGPENNINVTSANLASNDNAYYSSLYLDYAVQLPDGVTAYTAVVDKANNKVTLNKIEDGIVPANTGVVLRMTTAANYELTATSTTNEVASDLKGVTEDTPVSEIYSTPYVLSIYNNSPAFQKYSGTTLRANKAYLILPSSAKSFKFDFADDEVDGIKSLTTPLSNREGVVYNLNGQRISKGSKGIVIVNGKKYLNK